MTSLTGLSPNNPRDYVGPNVALNTVVTRNRAPTGADYRQPETGKLYPFNTYWLVGKDPTTGVQGDLWYLSKIAGNVGFWLQLSTGGSGPLLSVDVQSATAPGVDPVTPTGGGVITVNGAAVANHAVPLETHTRALNTFNIEVQYATSAASTTANLSGIAHFNSSQFTVDANGFVSLAGGGLAIDSIQVDGSTPPGTNPVAPDATGLITVTGAQVATGTTVNGLRTFSLAANAYEIQIQRTTTAAVSTVGLNGICHFDSTDFSVDANGFVTLAGAGAGQTITGDTGGALPPTAGNWNIVGGVPLSAGTNASVTSGAGSTLTVTSINCAKWIVDSTANRGTHTTIQGAITAASSGETVFIRPGTYTEDLTLKAGVNLTAFECDSSLNATGHVIISGNATLSTAGSVTITGIQLQTNSAAFLTVSGSAASIVNLNNCHLNCTNATGISYSSSSASSLINVFKCTGNLGTTGIGFHSMSSAGNLVYEYCYFTNTGNSVTASTNSAGFIFFNYSTANIAFSTSSTGTFLAAHSIINPGVNLNVTAITTAGTSALNEMNFCNVSSGSASTISIGSGTTMFINNSLINSSNTNAITGAGTVIYSLISFFNTSSLINTTTQTRRNISTGGISFDGGTNTLSNYTEGTFTPTMVGATTAGTTTYTSQNGYYRRIGNLVTIQFSVNGSAATGTGFVVFGGFPFTVKNQTNGSPTGSIQINVSGAWTFPAGGTYLILLGATNTTTGNAYASGSGSAGNFWSVANAPFNINATLTYQI